MKVALIRQRYNPYGGAERFVERALSALVAQHVEMTLFAREWSGEAASKDSFRTTLCDPFFIGRVWRDWEIGRAHV